MPVTALSRLEPVELFDVWSHEAHDFTPWLATVDNIKQLGDALGIELEVEATEQHVGSFKADILCRNLSDQSRVLIENQLNSSDHSHLGQLLTYTAGLDAATIIWVASKFRDEHRAAIDWLNQNTNDGVDFFAVEIEVWRIGDSPPAPRFNIACRPNDWADTVKEITKASDGELTSTQEIYLEYWTALRDRLEDMPKAFNLTKPQSQMWYPLSIGKAGAGMNAAGSLQTQKIMVEVWFSGPYALSRFETLRQSKDEVESEVGEPLDWYITPSQKQCHVRLWRENSDMSDRSNRNEQIGWLASRLLLFHKVFAPRIKALPTKSTSTNAIDVTAASD